jgi:hypothetical protein
MRTLLVLSIVGLLALATAAFASPDNTATQTVNYQVDAINVMSTSGAATVHITTATPGAAPTQASDTSTTYQYTSNETKKITAEINSNMPSGLTLKVTLAAPTASQGTSAGAKTLSTSAVDVVTEIAPCASDTGKAITYTLDATPAAGPISAASKTVTFTIIDNVV